MEVWIGWTGLAPWELKFSVPGRLTSTVLWQVDGIPAPSEKSSAELLVHDGMEHDLT